MSLEVSIIKVSQDVDLSDGSMENFIILVLPNGSIIRAKVNEQAAQAVMACFVNGEKASSHVDQVAEEEVRIPEGFHETTSPNGQPVLEFGGDAPPLRPSTVPRLRPRHVAADDAGNPIMEPRDMGEISSSTDEDGVGQI